MDIAIDDLLKLLGQKDLEIFLLQKKVAELEADRKNDKPENLAQVRPLSKS